MFFRVCGRARRAAGGAGARGGRLPCVDRHVKIALDFVARLIASVIRGPASIVAVYCSWYFRERGIRYEKRD